MKPNKNITYYCSLCGAYTSTLHEIIYGSLFRQISIDYNVQLPLCQNCHHGVHHGKNKDELRDELLEKLCLKYGEVIQLYTKTPLRYLLGNNKEYRADVIRSFEV